MAGSALQQPIDGGLQVGRVRIPVAVYLPTGPAGDVAGGPAPSGDGVVGISQTGVVTYMDGVSSPPVRQVGRHDASGGLEGPCHLDSHFELQVRHTVSVDHDVVAISAQVALAKECPPTVSHRLPSRREFLPALSHPA